MSDQPENPTPGWAEPTEPIAPVESVPPVDPGPPPSSAGSPQGWSFQPPEPPAPAANPTPPPSSAMPPNPPMTPPDAPSPPMTPPVEMPAPFPGPDLPPALVSAPSEISGVLPAAPPSDIAGMLPESPSDISGVLPAGPVADIAGVLPAGPAPEQVGMLPQSPSAPEFTAPSVGAFEAPPVSDPVTEAAPTPTWPGGPSMVDPPAEPSAAPSSGELADFEPTADPVGGLDSPTPLDVAPTPAAPYGSADPSPSWPAAPAAPSAPPVGPPEGYAPPQGPPQGLPGGAPLPQGYAAPESPPPGYAPPQGYAAPQASGFPPPGDPGFPPAGDGGFPPPADPTALAGVSAPPPADAPGYGFPPPGAPLGASVPPPMGPAAPGAPGMGSMPPGPPGPGGPAGPGGPGGWGAPPGGGAVPPPYGAPPGGAWPPGQPVAAAPGNGVATAAMIVGIISVLLCFAFVGGVAAVVLGVIGLGKAKQLGGRKKGQAIAGLVLGVLSIAIGIGFWVVVRRGVDTVADNLNELGGEADRSTYKVTVETCELDEFGSATAAGTITNTTNKTKNFQVEVEFVRGGKVLDSGSALVDGIEPDGSQDWSVQGSIDGGQAVRCTVTGVFNRLN